MSLDELKTQNIRTVTEKHLYALLKTASQIQRSRRSQRPQDLPSAPFTAIFRQKATLLFPLPSATGSSAKEYIAWELDTHDYEHLSGIEQISIILKSYANILFIDPEGIRFSLDAEVALFNAGKNDRVINRPPDKFEEYTGRSRRRSCAWTFRRYGKSRSEHKAALLQRI